MTVYAVCIDEFGSDWNATNMLVCVCNDYKKAKDTMDNEVFNRIKDKKYEIVSMNKNGVSLKSIGDYWRWPDMRYHIKECKLL